MTAPAALERLDDRREAAETLLRAGVADGIGPGAWAASLDRRFIMRPHLEVMDRHLARLLIEPGGSVMFTTPPRVGKSVLCSQWLPAWWVSHRYRDRVVLAAYGDRLAMRHTVAARGHIAAYGPQYGLALSREQATKSDWSLSTGGGMIARGVGAGLTGEDMHLGIIDDPVKDRAAAESETIRQAAWDWYSGSFLSRVEPHTRRVVIMTRWRDDDLAGRILESEGRIEEGGTWRVVHLPALALPPNPAKGLWHDPLDRAPGEPLTHPKIDPDDTAAMLTHWEQQRARSTVRDWNALYQGVPRDVEGSLLTDADVRDRTGTAPTEWRRVAVGVDPAGGGRDTVGIIVAALDRQRHAWLLDDRTAKMSAVQWPAAVCAAAHDHEATQIVVEKNFGGDMAKQLIAQTWEELSRDGHVSGLCPLVVEVTARKSKVLRAEPIAQAVKTGRVWFARGAQLGQLKMELTMWQPGSSWSPGALDAAVHVVTDLLPAVPRGAELINPASRRIGSGEARGGLAARRRAS